MADLGGLVDLSQRYTSSSHVSSANFVPPGEHFNVSLRGATNPVNPTTSVRGGGYTPDAQGGPCSENGQFVSLANTEFEKGKWNVSTPLGLPMDGREAHCYPSATPRE
jgi:hypothetical protein